jgi:2-C-methyl-D-erythritol 4-phosphate cytidylyltransferase
MGVAKAFVPLDDQPLLWHAVCGVMAAGCVDAVVVAVPPPSVDCAAELLASFGGAVAVVAGGLDRVRSVRFALDHAGALRPGIEVVLVHDAARALTPPAVFAAVVAAVRAGHGAVVPVVPLVDTVKRVDAAGRVLDTVDRSTLRAVQTPQGFAPDVLRRAHAAVAGPAGSADGAGVRVTDDAGLVEACGEPVHTVPGDQLAFKITTPFDLAVARALLATQPWGVVPARPSGMWASQGSSVEQWDAHMPAPAERVDGAGGGGTA